jgi:hypothetical protein
MAKTIKINYYHNYDHGTYPFRNEMFSIDPYPKIRDHSSKELYYDCPAWSHKAKRTFVVRSPMDFHFQLTPIRTENGTEYYLRSSSIPQHLYSKIVVLDKDWYGEKEVTIQLCIPQIFFWTNHKKIWMEVRSCNTTASKNNFYAIGGWFCVSAWSRPASFAFNIVDREKPIIIKRGDPLYEVCFYSQDPNDNFILKKETPSKKVYDDWMERMSLKHFQRNLSVKYMFGQKEKESKCPFAFLWNKK